MNGLYLSGITDQLKLNLSTSKAVYHAREQIKLNLTAQDKALQPVTGNFSIAVTDETNVPVNENKESTILSHLLLTSDLKGYVEKPNYYFNDKNEKAVDDLDELMLTQGYHRFEWRPLLGAKYQAAATQPEEVSAVYGTIETAAGKPIPLAKCPCFR